MARLLSDLLGATEPDFSLMLKRLEQVAGQPSADIRLSTEITAAAKRKIRQVHLDVHDTTGPELYHALLRLVQKHDELLAQHLGVSKAADIEGVAACLRKALQSLNTPGTCWALKPAAAKRLLKNTPPKKVMKQLGYRSIDSMLKREKPAELFCAISFLESAAWQERFAAKYKTLDAGDFEDRSIEVLAMPSDKWGEDVADFAYTRRRNLLCVREMGIIALLPLPMGRLQGLTITMLPLIIHCLHQIRLFSVYCKLGQVRADFGMVMAQTLAGQRQTAAYLADIPLSWPLLQRHFGGSAGDGVLEVLEPHISAEDLGWSPIGQTIAGLHKELDFWRDPDYLGMVFPGGVVSCNLLDVSLNYCNNVPYHKRFAYYFRESLWHELFSRYLRQPHLEQDVIKQMETHLTA